MMSESEVRHLLEAAQTIAVVGMSDDPLRDSNSVARFLKRNGYTVIPVNPNLRGLVMDEVPFASLHDVDQPVDIVLIFRRPEFVPEIAEDAIAIGARAIWMQPGAGNTVAALRAQRSGLLVAINHCIAVEHRRLMRDFEPVYA